mmetsp:Transcript_15994/g.41122  ORF Transcript_15994/g.41122 Transcript_15994/m.41122 type:complete len:314 (+) Transcript_15994:272-1213(+)
MENDPFAALLGSTPAQDGLLDASFEPSLLDIVAQHDLLIGSSEDNFRGPSPTLDVKIQHSLNQQRLKDEGFPVLPALDADGYPPISFLPESPRTPRHPVDLAVRLVKSPAAPVGLDFDLAVSSPAPLDAEASPRGAEEEAPVKGEVSAKDEVNVKVEMSAVDAVAAARRKRDAVEAARIRAESAREAFKSRAVGDRGRMKRKAEAECTPVEKQEKYSRRLHLNRQSAAAARVRREVYIAGLEEGLSKMEASRDALAEKVVELGRGNQELKSEVERLRAALVVAKAGRVDGGWAAKMAVVTSEPADTLFLPPAA